MLRPSILVFVLALNACSKSPDSGSTAKQPVDSWLTYEDDMFRVKYPPNSEVMGAVDGKQNPKSPTLGVIPPPAAGKSIIGAFTLQPDSGSKGMLLRDGLASELEKSKGDRGIVVTPSREIQVSNGRCLGALIITPTKNCEPNSGSCFAPIYSVLCDGPSGTRYTAGTVFSSGPDRDKLSPQAQQEAATYERILRSLEFKKS